MSLAAAGAFASKGYGSELVFARAGETLELSAKEFGVLEALMRAPLHQPWPTQLAMRRRVR